MTTTLQVYKAKQHLVYHFSAALQCNCNINMKNLLIIIQTLIMLTSSLLCLSQECYNKEEIYTGTKLPYSCKHILTDYPATPSGYYLIQPPGASTVQVYCDMENEQYGSSKGWTRVAHVDVSNDESCPGDLTFISSPIQSCGGPTTAGCASANYSTHGISYSQVCGRLRGYQVGGPNAIVPYVTNLARPHLVMDGVLMSHGKTRKHIWAYACGIAKSIVYCSNYHFPCTDPRYDGIVPPFIGNDYYCDSGVVQWEESSTLHHCGLVKDILLQISAAPGVECRGFVIAYLFPLLTTLRYTIVTCFAKTYHLRTLCQSTVFIING